MPEVLRSPELRQEKPSRDQFPRMRRRPIRVVLDGVAGGYNVGALFRLCDAMLLERLIICGPTFTFRKRSIWQAAQGTQHWVPWEHRLSIEDCVSDARRAGYQIAVIELTTSSLAPADFVPRFPLCLVIGAERTGVTSSIAKEADAALAIPMLGMANSLNLATAAAIVFHEICKHAPTEMVLE